MKVERSNDGFLLHLSEGEFSVMQYAFRIMDDLYTTQTFSGAFMRTLHRIHKKLAEIH